MKTILIIDDDIHIGNALEETLKNAGYMTKRAYSGTEAELLLSNSKPDLVLLDLMLPGLTGEELLPKIKDIPVIIMSAKTDIDGKVNLLMNGAVDYVTKPFNTKELLARIAVALRNSNPSGAGDTLKFRDIELDLTNHSAQVSGKPVKLTKTEFAILKLLMLNPTQIMSKSALLDKISIDTPDCVESSLKVHMSNLRKKLREANDEDYIESVWGIGFKMKDLN